MHEELRRLLQGAEGHSQRVISIFLDVRGFSSFARIAESSDAAEFLRCVYLRILRTYFPRAAFFKLTGDGMLVIHRFDRSSLKRSVRSAVSTSLRLVQDFPTIAKGDPMVNFPVPTHLGVGIARGAATALVSDETILDYTGRPLNLAARLMDIARPAGVVFDESLVPELLTPAMRKRFAPAPVYLAGIAEEASLTAYCSDGIEVPEFNKHPINNHSRVTDPEFTFSVKELEEMGSFRHRLKSEPMAAAGIVFHISYPEPMKNGRAHPKWKRNFAITGEYLQVKGGHYARIDYGPVAKRIKAAGGKGPWKVQISIEYSVRGD